MRIIFLGAIGTVTGSTYLLSFGSNAPNECNAMLFMAYRKKCYIIINTIIRRGI